MPPYRLTVCGIVELDRFARSGVTHVLSLLDPVAPLPDALAEYGNGYEHRVIRFDDVLTTEPGFRAPEPGHIRDVLSLGETLAEPAPGTHLLVHCHAGVSRSTAAAAILMARHNPGAEEEAFAAVGRIRPQAWPNTLMIHLADALLGCQGRLVEALLAYRRQAVAQAPWLSELVESAGRAHELP